MNHLIKTDWSASAIWFLKESTHSFSGMFILNGRIGNSASNIFWQFDWSNTSIDWLTRNLSISILMTQIVKNVLVQGFICTRLRDKIFPCLCMFLNHRRACFLNLNTFEIKLLLQEWYFLIWSPKLAFRINEFWKPKPNQSNQWC